MAYEEKIRVLERDLENTTNLLKFSEKENAKVNLEKQDLKTRLDNEVARHMEWQKATKHLDKLVDSCQSVKSRRGLGYGDFIGPNEVYEPNQQSIFDPTPEEYYQIPVRYIKEGGMNVVSPPITGKFKPTYIHTDVDESQMTYGKKSIPYEYRFL